MRDYQALEREYITGTMRLRELCRRHGVNAHSAVVVQAKQGGWAELAIRSWAVDGSTTMARTSGPHRSVPVMADDALPVSPAGATVAARPGEQAVDPREAQFLTTEHWSLLATRSLSWNEAFSRSAMFLSTLSAGTVALALVGPATSFGQAFVIFALVILSVTLFLGVATFVRLTQVNNEDLYWVAGMNRLRAAYVRLVPGIEAEFFSGWTVDAAGISRTFAAIDVMSRPSPVHMLVTTPAVVGIISTGIAGVIVGLVAIQVGSDLAFAIAMGLLLFVVGITLLIAYAVRENRRYVGRIAAIVAAGTGRRADEEPGAGPVRGAG